MVVGVVVVVAGGRVVGVVAAVVTVVVGVVGVVGELVDDLIELFELVELLAVAKASWLTGGPERLVTSDSEGGAFLAVRPMMNSRTTAPEITLLALVDQVG